MRGRTRLAFLAVTLFAALSVAPGSASAAFGFLSATEGFDAVLTKQDSSTENRAGTHPYSLRLSLGMKTAAGFADGDVRDAHIDLPPGLLINPTQVGECSATDFHTPRISPFEQSRSGESCANSTQIGVAAVRSSLSGGETRYFGVFNLAPPYGSPGAIGFSPYGVPIVLTPHVREADAGLTLDLESLPQSFDLQRLELTLWGTPWSTDHDAERGNCLNEQSGGSFGTCLVLGATGAPLEQVKSVLTLPTAPCGVPLIFTVRAVSWQGGSAAAEVESHDTGGTPQGLIACNRALTLGKLQLRSDRAGIGTGAVFTLDVNDGGGILNPKGIARPAIRKAVVSLPEGLTINPSVAAGLGTCTEADFAREEIDTVPGAGCPNTSKIGEVRVDGMLGLAEPLTGSLYVAKPYENPFGSLVAVYMLIRNPRRGLLVKSTGDFVPDPRTGRLVATFEELPRLLYTHFELSLREGQRTMLVSPPSCGLYGTDVEMSSWDSADAPSHETSFLPINAGPSGGPCPSAGPPPFAPGLQAGSLNPAAASYSPFYLHMTRSDLEQEIASYSATFPPGLLGKIAGIPYCSEAAIEAAKLKTGGQEQASPSCPAASRIGHTLAGYGVGGVLAYAPGALYLAGPYRGAPLSTVAIDAAQVGPFDLGVVVVRSAIRVDPRTAQVQIDSQGSDPIPHVLKGIPLHLRDIRVYVDRPDFTLNPTDCDPLQSLSTLGGAGADPFNPGDDSSAISNDHFQVLNCSALGFKPRLFFAFKGGTHRGQYPSLRATYVPRAGDANLSAATVTLPPSLFLAQEHINTLCTRPQFRAGNCPPGSIYGHARAITPLLDEPFEGPVYLRASDNRLPDIVADLRGKGIEIEVPARIDSDRGAIRAHFEGLPDAPVTKFKMTLNGGKKGILVNAGGICSSRLLAKARFLGQNNKLKAFAPRMRVRCGGRSRQQRKRRGTEIAPQGKTKLRGSRQGSDRQRGSLAALKPFPFVSSLAPPAGVTSNGQK